MSSGAIPAAVISPHRRPLFGDERLALRVADGDERAFATLYERYHQRLFRYCISILRDEADAADALQSTFERALRALRAQQRSAPLRPWLYRIAHNEAITLIRRRPPQDDLAQSGPAWAASAEHVAGERDRLATLVTDLAGLPERARSALVMRELEGLSHEDIAIALGTTVGAAKQAIFEARRALCDAAEGRAMSCPEIRRLVSDGDRRVLRGRRVRAHLNACAGCGEFATAISRRRADLKALAPPLAPAAAGAILARASGGLAGHGSQGLSAAAGTGGLGKGALATLAGSKAALGVAVIATASVGVAGVAAVRPLVSHRARPRAGAPAAAHLPAGPTGRPSSLGHHAAAARAVSGAQRTRHGSGSASSASASVVRSTHSAAGRAPSPRSVAVPGTPTAAGSAAARSPGAAAPGRAVGHTKVAKSGRHTAVGRTRTGTPAAGSKGYGRATAPGAAKRAGLQPSTGHAGNGATASGQAAKPLLTK